MGNCCEAVDARLESLMEINKENDTLNIKCSAKDSFSRASTGRDSILQENREILEEKFLKFRNRIRKLNTIIEDKREDFINSPFVQI